MEEVKGSIEETSGWKGISLKKLERGGDEMKKLSGLDSKDIKSYKIGFILDQDYGTAGPYVKTENKEEEKSFEKIGLVEPMIMKRNKEIENSARDIPSQSCMEKINCCNTEQTKEFEYKDQLTKTTYKKLRRAFCCTNACCGGKKYKLQTHEYIMTYEIGEKSKPTVVLIHGYGGSALVFFRLYKHFKEKYHVIMIDLLGKGASSRPYFLADTQEEAENFHIQALEKWREKMGLEKMTLIGHSFGGYVSAKYTISHPDRVERLILWSPLGVENEPPNLTEKLKLTIRRDNFVVASWKGFTRCLLNYECNIFNWIRFWGRCCAPCVVRSYVRRHFPDFSDEEIAATYPYIYQITMLRSSGENSLYKILKTSVLANSPYFDDVVDLKDRGMKISFVYGDRDWLDTDMNDVKISQQLKEAGFKVDVLEDGGHHLYFDNPEDLLRTMDETLLGEYESDPEVHP